MSYPTIIIYAEQLSTLTKKQLYASDKIIESDVDKRDIDIISLKEKPLPN